MGARLVCSNFKKSQLGKYQSYQKILLIKKCLEYHFLLKKKLKRGVHNRRFGLRKISVCFQISKSHNSVNFCFRQKSYLKKRFGVSFSIEKKNNNNIPKNRKKNWISTSKNHNSKNI